VEGVYSAVRTEFLYKTVKLHLSRVTIIRAVFCLISFVLFISVPCVVICRLYSRVFCSPSNWPYVCCARTLITNNCIIIILGTAVLAGAICSDTISFIFYTYAIAIALAQVNFQGNATVVGGVTVATSAACSTDAGP
jgi:hypothetical protein